MNDYSYKTMTSVKDTVYSITSEVAVLDLEAKCLGNENFHFCEEAMLLRIKKLRSLLKQVSRSIKEN